MEEIEYGYMLLTDEELSKSLGYSVQTIKKYNKELIKLGYLEIIEVDGKKIKRYNLTKLNGK